MNDDPIFRQVLLVGWLTLLPMAAFYRIRSQLTGEKLDRRQEGLFILLTLRPTGAVAALGLIAYLVNPSWMAWSSVRLPASLRWAGVGVGAIAAVFLIWTMHSLGKNLTDTVVTRREHSLVTLGPYRWVRHPFYDSVALCLFASSLVAANWFLLLAGASLVALFVVRTRTEEEKLLLRFGEPYQVYIKRTGRFLPRI